MQPAASREEEKHKKDGGIKSSKAEVRVGIGSHNPGPPPLLTASLHAVRIPDASLPRQALFMPLNKVGIGNTEYPSQGTNQES